MMKVMVCSTSLMYLLFISMMYGYMMLCVLLSCVDDETQLNQVRDTLQSKSDICEACWIVHLVSGDPSHRRHKENQDGKRRRVHGVKRVVP